jgi:mannose-6-phosphate isomerase-like protein (cupin superfamily)
MNHKTIFEIKPFVTTDGSLIREIFHPQRHNLPMSCSIAHATVKTGESTKPHTLKKSSEIYVILSGQGIMHINDEKQLLNQGDAVFIPAGSVQYIENAGEEDLNFLCVVDPYWKDEDDEVIGMKIQS